MKEKKVYKNRLVCFLDVLGYSQKIKDKSPEEIYNEYSTFIDKAKKNSFYGKTHHQKKDKKTFEEYMIMSDSMLFISSDTQDTFSVNNFVGAIQYILELGLEHEFTFRGAIGLDTDEIIFDSSRNIIISKEFNELTKLETKIEMPTCVIRKNAENLILKSFYGKDILAKDFMIQSNSSLIKYNMPIKKYSLIEKDMFKKENYKEEMWCLNYTFFSSDDILENIKSYLIDEKKIYFIEYLEYLKTLQCNIQKLPINFFPKYFAKIMISNTGMKVAYLDISMKKTLLIENINYPYTISSPPGNVKIGFDRDKQQIEYKFSARYEDASGSGTIDITTWNNQEKLNYSNAP